MHNISYFSANYLAVMFLFITQLMFNPQIFISPSGVYLDLRTSDACLSQVSLLSLHVSLKNMITCTILLANRYAVCISSLF